jgi:HEAT repeat protein
MRSTVLMLSLVTLGSLAIGALGCGGPPAAARERIRVRLANGDQVGAIAAYKEWRGTGEDDRDSLRALALTAVWSSLQSGDPQVRAAAARLAERLNDERLFNGVVGLLRDQDPVVRATAAGAILRGHPDAPGILYDSLTGPDARARAVAVEVIARKLGKGAVDDLRKALADPDDGVRAAACDAIAAIGDRDSAATLTVLAKDKAGPVRASALAALGRIQASESRTTIQFALDDAYLGARIAALGAYEALLGDGAVPELTRVAKAQPRAVSQITPAPSSNDIMLALRAGVILARRGDRAAGRGMLEAALASKDWIVRAAAANASVEIAGKSDATKLLAATARDPIPEVRLAAARALLIAGDRTTAEKTFHSCFGLSEELQIQAASDLARLGEAKSLDVFGALLVAKDPMVRRAAAAAAPDQSPILPQLLDALADADDGVRLAAAATIL